MLVNHLGEHMKATFTLEDTPTGISAELRWEGSGCSDHLASSLSMMVMAQFAEVLKAHAKAGIIKLDKEEA